MKHLIQYDRYASKEIEDAFEDLVTSSSNHNDFAWALQPLYDLASTRRLSSPRYGAGSPVGCIGGSVEGIYRHKSLSRSEYHVRVRSKQQTLQLGLTVS